MPRPDLPSPQELAKRHDRPKGNRHPPPFQEPLRYGGKRKPHRDLDDGGVPVDPNKPLNLSGGAAAAMEFDD